MGSLSLEDGLRANFKTVTYWRIFLALLVLYSHSYPLFSGSPDIQIPFFIHTSVSFGAFAVGGFFALSGLLLAQSASKVNLRDWAKRRILRIFPAYLLCLVVSSFVIAPLDYVFTNKSMHGFWNFSNVGPLAYVWNNSFMPTGITYALNQTFTTTPYGLLTKASVVNGSIWSLPYELHCYFVFSILCYGLALFKSRHAYTCLTIFVFGLRIFSTNRIVLGLVHPIPFLNDTLFLQLFSVFLMGVLLYN